MKRHTQEHLEPEPIPLKTEHEIDIMREAGRIVAHVHAELAQAIAPGVSTWDLDVLAANTIAQHGAVSAFLGYAGFPAHTCVSVNEELVHGIPKRRRKLKAGDIVSIDVGVKYQGYVGDSAWTYAVGKVSEQAWRLMKVTKESLYAGIAAAQAGNAINDVSRAVQQHVERHSFHVVRQFTGHGVGRDMHEPPQIMNFVRNDVEAYQQMPIGLVFALEPMVQVGTWRTRMLRDQWTVISQDRSLAAHFEHTIAITRNGPRILTKL